MSATPDADTITIGQTLDLLDTKFFDFAEGVSHAHYAFWLGSGISLQRFPGLSKLIVKVLEHLRNHIDSDDPHCRFRTALEQALSFAGLTKTGIQQCDTNINVEDWPKIKEIKSVLSSNYARLLDIEIDGEDDDMLVWEGVDVVGTYADSSVEPDVAHYCIAVLILEGGG